MSTTWTLSSCCFFSVGSIYFHDCSMQPKVPMFLIVFGSVSLLASAVHLIKRIVYRNEDESTQTTFKRNFFEAFAVVFLVFCFVIGSFYIFQTWQHWSEQGHASCSEKIDSNDCCDPALMYFAFISLILIYFLVISASTIGCCCFCLIALLSGAMSE